MAMEKVVEVKAQKDVQALLALDEPGACTLCGPADTKAALGALEGLAVWWVSDTQRLLWQVQTLIEGRRGDAGICSASFKIIVPDRPLPLPVALVLGQHWEGKRLPHYQLQVPHGDLGKGIEDAGLAARVAALKQSAERETAVYRAVGVKSIALQGPWPLAEWVALQDAVARIVVGLRALRRGVDAG
jgi:hypothetical protein